MRDEKYRYKALATAVVVASVVGIGFLTLQSSSDIATRSLASDKDVYSRISRSIVRLSDAENSQAHRFGTGFLIKAESGNEYLITNWHVCQGLKGDMRAYRKGEFEDVVVKPLYDRFDLDFCILTNVPGPALDISPTVPVRFQDLYIVGHPRHKEQTGVRGTYIGEEVIEVAMPMEAKPDCAPENIRPEMFSMICVAKFLTGSSTAAAYPGNSGSPIVNAKGEVVGLVNASDAETAFSSFIPIRFIKDELLSYEHPKNAFKDMMRKYGGVETADYSR